MPIDRIKNKSRKCAKLGPQIHDGRTHPRDSHAKMRESVDLTPMPGPHGSAEASETIDRISEVVNNFPASMQVSTALEPLQGEMTNKFQADAAADSLVGLTVREMRRAGLTSETIWETNAT